MTTGMEEVCGTITRYAIFESHYLLESSVVKAQLVEAIVKLYVAVLKYLIAANRYCNKRTGEQALESILKSARTAVDAPLTQIREEQAKVNELAKLVDAELETAITEKSPLNGKVSVELKQEITDKLGSGAQGIREDAQAVFKWLLCARVPLSTKALLEAVSSVVDDEIRIPEKETILQICANLILIDEETDTFRFSHLSVQEFLEKESEYSSSELNSFAAMRCIEEFLPDRRFLRDSDSIGHSDALSFHAYAIAYWASHFSATKAEDRRNENMEDVIRDFLCEGESFNTFHSEAMEAKTSLCGYSSNDMERLLAAEPTCIFTICTFGLDNLLDDLDDQDDIDWNQKNLAGNTPMHLCMENGHEDMVKFLIGRGDVQLIERGADVGTALGAAALGGHKSISRPWLDQEGVYVDAVNNIVESPLIVAASCGTALTLAIRFGHHECVEALLKADPSFIDRCDKWGRDALSYGAESGSLAVVEALVKTGCVETNRTDINGWTPLMYACYSGDLEVFELVLKQEGVQVHPRNKFGDDALHYACQGGNEAIVNKLLELEGIDANSRNNLDETPLHSAIMENRIDVFRTLLSRTDVDVNATNFRGSTPLILALVNHNSAIALKLLDRDDVDVTLAPKLGSSAIFHAAYFGYEEVVRRLLANDQVNLQSLSTFPPTKAPLHDAVEGGDEFVVKMFLEHAGVDVNVRGGSGRTPLSYAAIKGWEDITQLLLEHNANPDAMDEDGNTLLCIAAREGQVHVVNMLLGRGAKEKLDEALRLTDDMSIAAKPKDLRDFDGLERLFGNLE
ncbi:MAG: hypothetical protein Q9217_005596, partial [Psora testacea]